ncbi:MAG TPA: hypothetical protein VN653_02595 [Anaerolineales bacterium]|nr:hypothetical protein [Anaerolineales bacterium]
MEDTVTVLCDCLIVNDESLDKAAYEIVRNSILKNLLSYGAMTSKQLGSLVKSHLKRKLCNSLWQYYETVREDLETRGEIRCVWIFGLALVEIAA